MKIFQLCKTISNLPWYAVKITNSDHQIEVGQDLDQELLTDYKRKWVVLTWRVHPGESNASFIMEGILTHLLWSQEIESNFSYIIIPFLNPDGVFYGKYRWNMAGTDLNRIWNSPSKYFHPTIYYTKELLTQIHNGTYFKEIDEINEAKKSELEDTKILELADKYSLSRECFKTPKSTIKYQKKLIKPNNKSNNTSMNVN